jgi:hypothetical protein
METCRTHDSYSVEMRILSLFPLRSHPMGGERVRVR